MKMRFKPQQVQTRIEDIRAALKHLTDTYTRPENAQLQVIGHIGELSVALSERAEIATQRLERQTTWLVWLTVTLSILTAALLAFTAVLYKDSHKLLRPEPQSIH